MRVPLSLLASDVRGCSWPANGSLANTREELAIPEDLRRPPPTTLPSCGSRLLLHHMDCHVSVSRVGALLSAIVFAFARHGQTCILSILPPPYRGCLHITSSDKNSRRPSTAPSTTVHLCHTKCLTKLSPGQHPCCPPAPAAAPHLLHPPPHLPGRLPSGHPQLAGGHRRAQSPQQPRRKQALSRLPWQVGGAAWAWACS